jgi:hypothetical protein
MLNKKYQVTIKTADGKTRRRIVLAETPGEAKRKVLLKIKLGEAVEDIYRAPIPGIKKTAKKAAPRKTAKPKSWNNSEILYAVLGYLTTRETPLILSGHHEAGAVAAILGKIIEANRLPKTRPNFPKIKIPDDVENIGNMTRAEQKEQINNQAECGPAKKTPDEIAGHILNQLLNQAAEDQNKIMATVVKMLHTARKKEYEYLNAERNRFNDGIEQAAKNNNELASILKESF